MQSYKVLVVDDEAPIRDLFDDLLKKENCIVKSASSGEESLTMINEEDFDIVLLDIKLPGMSGLDALKQIKAVKPGLIVIMITGFGYDESLIKKSQELGCSGYIGKNLPISQILNNFRLFLKFARDKAANRKD
jgi:two-component system response regulator (stage 0 sporulation protein F)